MTVPKAVAGVSSVIADPDQPQNVLRPKANGSIDVNGTFSAAPPVGMALEAKQADLSPVSAAVVSSVASAAASTQVAAANAARKGLLFFNDDANTAYVKYGTGASATSYSVAMVAGAYWEMPLPIYTGLIHALWSADGTGSMRVTEF